MSMTRASHLGTWCLLLWLVICSFLPTGVQSRTVPPSKGCKTNACRMKHGLPIFPPKSRSRSHPLSNRKIERRALVVNVTCNTATQDGAVQYRFPAGTGPFLVQVTGAAGGDSRSFTGGQGITMSGVFDLPLGIEYMLLVGCPGETSAGSPSGAGSGGGGGGSYIWRNGWNVRFAENIRIRRWSRIELGESRCAGG